MQVKYNFFQFLSKYIANIAKLCYDVKNRRKGEAVLEEICSYRAEDLYFHHSLSPQPDPDRFSMHAHEMNEVLVFLSGTGSMLVEGNEYPMFPGAVMIMRAGESHKIRPSRGTAYERIGIRFSDSVFALLDPKGELLVPLRDRRLGSGNLIQIHSLQGLLPMLLKIGENASPYRIRLAVISFLFAVLNEASALHEKEDRLHREREEQGKNYEMIEYINHNLSADLSLDAIAARFYLSKSQLSRSFKKATGSTLWDYVLIKRLLLARSLIREGESISGACERSGFREYSSFYRAYKKRFGVSPNQDRTAGESIET